MLFARVVDGTVVDLWESTKELSSPSEVFHPDLPGEWAEAPKGTKMGWVKKGGSFVAPNTNDPEEVAAAQEQGRVSVDRLAEKARLNYLTPGLGQTLAYQAKVEEVRRYDRDTNPVKADYPYLSAEIGVTGDSLTAVADAVRSAVAVWAEKGPEIERTRLKAKSDIAKAETVDRIQAIVSAIEWP